MVSPIQAERAARWAVPLSASAFRVRGLQAAPVLWSSRCSSWHSRRSRVAPNGTSDARLIAVVSRQRTSLQGRHKSRCSLKSKTCAGRRSVWHCLGLPKAFQDHVSMVGVVENHGDGCWARTLKSMVGICRIPGCPCSGCSGEPSSKPAPRDLSLVSRNCHSPCHHQVPETTFASPAQTTGTSP